MLGLTKVIWGYFFLFCLFAVFFFVLFFEFLRAYGFGFVVYFWRVFFLGGVYLCVFVWVFLLHFLFC